MRHRVYRALAVAVAHAGLMVGWNSAAIAQAASPSAAFSPVTIDVAGVHLGMTPDETMAALKAFSPNMPIEKKYTNTKEFSINDSGEDLESLPETSSNEGYLDRSHAFLIGFAGETGKVEGGAAPTIDNETVHVWFSPVPGEERVVAVERIKTFHTDAAPPIDLLKSQLFTKYPEDKASLEAAGTESPFTVDWFFDPKGRLISKAAMKHKSASSNRGSFPSTVYAGDGVELSVAIGTSNENDKIASDLHMTLADGNGLFRTLEQSEATFKTRKAKTDAEAVAKAAKAAGQTKF
jgi:hypothetical protein